MRKVQFDDAILRGTVGRYFYFNQLNLRRLSRYFGAIANADLYAKGYLLHAFSLTYSVEADGLHIYTFTLNENPMIKKPFSISFVPPDNLQNAGHIANEMIILFMPKFLDLAFLDNIFTETNLVSLRNRATHSIDPQPA